MSDAPPLMRAAPPIGLALGADDRARAERYCTPGDLTGLPPGLRDITIATCLTLEAITLHFRLSVHEDKPGGLFLNPYLDTPLPPAVAQGPDEDFDAFDDRISAWYETPDGVTFLAEDRRLTEELVATCTRVEDYARTVCRICGAPGARYTVDINRVHVLCPAHAPRS